MSTAKFEFSELNADFSFFLDGLRSQRLLVQQCADCGKLRDPPAPICIFCQSFNWAPLPLSGRGSVYSYTVHYHPPLPFFDVPHPVALVEMVEGVRLLGPMDGTDPSAITVGASIRTEFLTRGSNHHFRFVIDGGEGQ